MSSGLVLEGGWISNAFVQNLLAGLIILVFEVVVISVIFNRILDWREERRWRGARALLGDRLWDINERFDVWWVGFERRALDPASYDGSVQTPIVFADVDVLIDRFGFAMNSDIAIAYANYRRELDRFEFLYRRLCIAYGGQRLGNILRYQREFTADGRVSFKGLKESFLTLIETLGYVPTRPNWWDPLELQEPRSSRVDLIDARQEAADFIAENVGRSAPE